MKRNSKSHWESIYKNKQPNEVSWTQEIPQTSLKFLKAANLRKSAAIIDVGGGDSKFVDYLLKEGYHNITVLDISENALNRAKQRLDEKANQINWIVSDITDFNPSQKFEFWHDRATFHFLTKTHEVKKYISIASKAIQSSGYLSIGTFSSEGPLKCSGLNIQQYDAISLCNLFSDEFQKIKCLTEDHETPLNTVQNFLFCLFTKELNQSYI